MQASQPPAFPGNSDHVSDIQSAIRKATMDRVTPRIALAYIGSPDSTTELLIDHLARPHFV